MSANGSADFKLIGFVLKCILCGWMYAMLGTAGDLRPWPAPPYRCWPCRTHRGSTRTGQSPGRGCPRSVGW